MFLVSPNVNQKLLRSSNYWLIYHSHKKKRSQNSSWNVSLRASFSRLVVMSFLQDFCIQVTLNFAAAAFLAQWRFELPACLLLNHLRRAFQNSLFLVKTPHYFRRGRIDQQELLPVQAYSWLRRSTGNLGDPLPSRQCCHQRDQIHRSRAGRRCCRGSSRKRCSGGSSPSRGKLKSRPLRTRWWWIYRVIFAGESFTS